MTSDVEVRYIEVDLPPIQVGLIVHVKLDHGPCVAAVITELLPNGEAHAHEFIPPGRVAPYRDRPYAFQPGGYIAGSYHRLAECADRGYNVGNTRLGPSYG